MSEYYVYVHKRKSDGKIFYVGKGKGRRAYEIKGRSFFWNRVYKKHGLLAEIIFRNLSEHQSFYLEKKMIQKIGRENLTNITDGGEGGSAPWLPESRQKRIIAIRKACKTPEWVKKNKAWTSSRRFKQIRSHESKKMHSDPYFKEKHKRNIKEKLNTPDNKERVSKQWLGVDRGDDFREKLSKAKTGVSFSESHRQNLRAGHSGQMKKVECVDKGIVFDSVFYACEWLQERGEATASCEAQIRHVCKGRSKTACGYIWRYKQ